jgi:hypothetical protein
MIADQHQLRLGGTNVRHQLGKSSRVGTMAASSTTNTASCGNARRG